MEGKEIIIQWFKNAAKSEIVVFISLLGLSIFLLLLSINFIKRSFLMRRLKNCIENINKYPDNITYQVDKIIYLRKILDSYSKCYIIDTLDIDGLISADPEKLNIFHSILKNTIDPYIKEYLVLKKQSDGYPY